PSIGPLTGPASGLKPFNFGNSLYVACATTGVVSTSTDSITWTGRSSGTASQLNAVLYGTAYVMGGVGGVITSSTDAVTWTVRTSGTTSQVNNLTYSSG